MTEGAAQATGSAAPWLERAARRPVLALLLLAMLAWLPGLSTLPPLDRDESRFAEASRQMAETGNYIDIRFASGTRYNKPIGIYWMQSAAATLAGPALRSHISVYRVPSLLGGILSLILTYECARAFASRKTALMAAILLGSTLLLTAESDIATTDAALLSAIVAAQAMMMRVYLAARDARYGKPGLAAILCGWVALGIGVLLKGPVILAVLAVTALALSLWDRDWRWLRGTRPLPGVVLAAAIVAPWAIAIGFASHGAFYQQSLGHDFAAKILGGEESHGAPPGYYLALASFTFWPATVFLIPAVSSAIVRRGDPINRYLLAWSGAAWLMFELVPTKLPHYILPVYPALAILCALWAAGSNLELETRRTPVLHYAAGAQFGLAALALAAASLFLPLRFGGAINWPQTAGTALALVASCAAIVFLIRQRVDSAAASAIASAVAFYLLLVFAVAPQLQDMWMSPRAAKLVADNRRPDDPPPVVAGYVEPSLVFALGSDTRIEPADDVAGAAAAQGGLALVDGRAEPIFLHGLSSFHAAARQLGQVSGFDYSNGRKERVMLYRVTPSPRTQATPEK
jgi:4-amino-4-deoxy-L-arabinose transferase-like glycosyltransferase